MRAYGKRSGHALFDALGTSIAANKVRARRAQQAELERALAEHELAGFSCPCCDGHDTMVAGLDSVRLPHAAEWLADWENITPALLAWARRKLRAA